MNNIIYNTKCAGYLQHYGLDNLIQNNIFAFVNAMDCAIDSGRAGGALTSNQQNCACNVSTSAQKCCSSFEFSTNIVYVNDTFGQDIFYDCCKTGYKNMTFDNNTYWSILQQNKFTFPDNLTLAQWEKDGKDIDVVIDDPQFVDASKYDFTLKSTSPAFKMGFKQINTANVGPNW